MEDVEFKRSHSHDELPEAGNDPGDPLRPEIDQEDSTPRAPLAFPNMDMEVTEWPQEVAAEEREDDGASDNESELSELDENQFGDFDPENIAIEERPAEMIDETNVNLIGVHKRKRTEGDEAEAKRKKKNRREKPRRGKKADEVEVGDGGGERRSKRSRKEGRVRPASAEKEPEEDLTPEERMSP